ncbi:MAG TPA: glycosyltransferase [Bryobacteraceae bacterium]|nr:glycosyltransferase [Bryobacteraceae bacterium]
MSVHPKQSTYTEARIAYWEEYARTGSRFDILRRGYRQRLREFYRFLIPPGMRVLELGSGEGDLLAAVEPSRGVGVDFCPAMIHRAHAKYPKLRFIEADAHFVDLGKEKFDFIIISDLVNDVWNVQRVFSNALRYAHPETRIILNSYSRLWEGPRRIAEWTGFAKRQPLQNWLTREDLENLFYLADFEVIRTTQEVLLPLNLPLIGPFANKFAVKLWPIRHLGLTNFLITRPAPHMQTAPEPIVSVIVAARNEAGNIANIFDRVPQMGRGTELIFVEGGSKDDTYSTIEREIAVRGPLGPAGPALLYRQSGKGKGDAVRLGFEKARGEVLMILDADLTVPPEDLPHFYEAWRSGRGEFVNGVRLVYPMEGGAMRFFNFLGNKFFSLAFSWLLGQSIKDTLCGTKVLSKAHYKTIADNRAYFGDFDPFGDFDLIFGAAHFNMKIVDLPVRYGERVYGDTNIQRWSHGWLLLKMVVYAMGRLKFV